MGSWRGIVLVWLLVLGALVIAGLRSYVGQRRLQRQAAGPLRVPPAARVRRDQMSRPLLARQGMEDRHDAGAARDEVVAKRLGRPFREAVGHDRELEVGPPLEEDSPAKR